MTSDKKTTPAPAGADDPLSLELVLEGPGMFSDEAIAANAAKFSLLESFINQLTRDQGFPDFVRELLLAIMKVVKCEAGSLLELDHQRNSLFFRAVVGTSADRVATFVIPMGQGVVGHVAEARRPLAVSNAAENELHIKAIQDAVGFEARNLVAVPIVIRGRVYGVLELLNRIGEPCFGAADVELLTYACDMASKIIEARLMIAWATRRGEAA